MWGGGEIQETYKKIRLPTRVKYNTLTVSSIARVRGNLFAPLRGRENRTFYSVGTLYPARDYIIVAETCFNFDW